MSMGNDKEITQDEKVVAATMKALNVRGESRNAIGAYLVRALQFQKLFKEYEPQTKLWSTDALSDAKFFSEQLELYINMLMEGVRTKIELDNGINKIEEVDGEDSESKSVDVPQYQGDSNSD